MCHKLPHETKGILLFPWCTRTSHILGQLNFTFEIQLMTMVGQAIHVGASTHGPKEPFLAMVWTHLGSFVRDTISFNFANSSR